MKKLQYLLSIILFSGTLMAYYSVYIDFARFYNLEGTIFKIQDCIIPNPVTTPCFWGAFAFLTAFIWSLLIIRKNEEQQQKHRKYMLWFLMGSCVFAWSNFSLELVKFAKAQGQTYTGCSGALVSNPFLTPCFYGSFIFLLALILGFKLYKEKTRS